MKIALLYPPYSNLRTAYLSLPTLSSYVKALGHSVIIKDLNLELFYDSLKGEVIEKAPVHVNEKELILKALPKLEEAKSILLKQENPTDVQIREAKQALKWAYKRLFKRHEGELDCTSISEIISSTFEEREDPLIAFIKNNVVPWLEQEGAEVVCMSIPYPNQMGPSLRLARLIKKRLPGVHIVIGGPQVTKFVQDLSIRPELFTFIDSIVVFEGERPMKVLLRVLEKKGDLSQVPNLIYYEGGRVIQNPAADPEPMNQLPTPDFEGLHLNGYLFDEMMLPLITSRGCYWGKCSFCTYREIHMKALEFRDIPLVVQDMKRLSERHQCGSIRIVDDAVPPKRCKALAREILAAGIHVKWRCSARLEMGFTAEVCKLMGQSGCEKVAFGLESYNQRVLDLMRKGIHVDHVKPILERFNGEGIKTHLNLMIGFPTETREEAEETQRFLEENKPLYTTFGIQTFNLEAGTELDRTPEKFGITKIFRDEKLRYGFRYGYRFETECGLEREEAEKITKESRSI
jgi:hypothetical protein